MRARIRVTGIVQGVGFRPFVYTLALRYHLKGFCLNDSQGVLIEVESDRAEDRIGPFVQALKAESPPLSRIDGLTVELLPGNGSYSGFSIRESRAEEGSFTLVSPDIAVCPDCLRELLDPGDRRYRYPFINCTNCGPRYSLVLDIPYDRPKTTMRSFTMCSDCEREYRNPLDRRFHAQPNACPACGPALALSITSPAFKQYEGADVLESAVSLLKGGAIIALKGLGGFHLCCDAADDGAVQRLREGKRRSNKPFALMAADAAAVETFCRVSAGERRLLESSIRPIVILEKRIPSLISDAVAPGMDNFGVMLPYTPLHHLLFHTGRSGAAGPFVALVMTSGNRAEEPIVIDNDEAKEKLSPLADAVVFHNRDIYMRVDDSIVRAHRLPSLPAPALLRRARGYVPETIELGEPLAEALACGADLKNTFCLTKGAKAIVSQHIGDLEHFETHGFFKETLKNLKNTFKVSPGIIAYDLHPDYYSTKLALAYAEEHGIPPERRFGVQHHHAHIAGVMAEHGLRGKVIGIALDGAGYGDDGALWGGEVLLADRSSYQRLAHFDYIPLPGGDRAVKEPWRCAVSYLYAAFGDEFREALPLFTKRFSSREMDVVARMIRNRLNAPLTSSTGRLFDAVSSLVGLKDSITYEGEAAIALETAAHACAETTRGPYPYNKARAASSGPRLIDMRPAIRGIVTDLRDGVAPPEIARRFHATVLQAIVAAAQEARSEHGVADVALSGGVFQNRIILEGAAAALAEAGFRVRTHEKVPVNDGCISLGQAVVAGERAKEGGERACV